MMMICDRLVDSTCNLQAIILYDPVLMEDQKKQILLEELGANDLKDDGDLQAGIPLDKLLMVFFESSNPSEGMANGDLQVGDPIG